MGNTVRTVHGAALQTSQLLGLPIAIRENTTLNQKFNINKDLPVASSDNVAMRYVTIGNGGHKMVVGTNNIPYPQAIHHVSRHAALYNHLPFVLRRPADDLTPAERQNYRLRRLETHDGVVYIAYYLKVLDLSETLTQLELRHVENNATTSTEFQSNLSDLSPEPPAIAPNGVLTTTGDYIAATAKVPFILIENDVDELLNVANIIYGDPNYAIISEIGLCSGADRTVVGDFNGMSTSYMDAIGVQIVDFMSVFYPVAYSNKQVNLTFDVGDVSPLLNIG